MTAAAFWFVHQVQAEAYTGSTRFGDSWAAAVPVDCFVDETTHLVVGADAKTVTSSAAVYAALVDRGNLPINSKVTLPSGRVARVIVLEVHDSGSLALDTEHVVAHLN